MICLSETGSLAVPCDLGLAQISVPEEAACHGPSGAVKGAVKGNEFHLETSAILMEALRFWAGDPLVPPSCSPRFLAVLPSHSLFFHKLLCR